VRFTRDVGTVTMDLGGVENIQFNALGGADTITVNDLTGTNVAQVNLDLGGNDGAADTVVLNATNGDDVIQISSDNGVVTVTGLGETVTIKNFDANDRIVINGLGGDDVIEASGLGTGIQLTANGGDGADILIQGAAFAPPPAVSAPTSPGLGAALLGQAMASSFVADGGGHGAIPMVDPHASQSPMLATPHA